MTRSRFIVKSLPNGLSAPPLDWITHVECEVRPPDAKGKGEMIITHSYAYNPERVRAALDVWKRALVDVLHRKVREQFQVPNDVR